MEDAKQVILTVIGFLIAEVIVRVIDKLRRR